MKTHRNRIVIPLLASVLVGLVACGGESDGPDSSTPAPGDPGSAETTSPGGSEAGPTGTGAGEDAGGVESSAPSDPGLLGELQTDAELGFSFRPPAGFQRAAGAFVDLAREALSQSAAAGGPYFTIPRMIFAVPGTDARIFVGEFLPQEGEASPSWQAGYLEAARSKAGAATFSHSAIELVERDALFLRIEAEAFRNDRVLYMTGAGERVQVDYLLPRTSLGSLEEAVAASVRSISDAD